VARRFLFLSVGLLAGCGAGQIIDLLNHLGNGSTSDKDLVVQCSRQDFDILKPFVLSLVDAALGDEPGPVEVSVTLPSGASMDIGFTGVDGSGLVVDVPIIIGFTCVITAAGVQGPPQVGEVTVTLESGGMLHITGNVQIEEKCQLFVLDGLDLRVDPVVLPVFRPAGSADVQAIADAALVVLSGTVTFDGTGKAVVAAVVAGASGPAPVNYSFPLN